MNFAVVLGADKCSKNQSPEQKTLTSNVSRSIDAKPHVVVAACPFCMTMLKDGVKTKEKESEIEVWTLRKSLPEQIDCKLH
ncbi:hypothetical protein A9970_00255 [Sphingobacterium sp. UME9]|nr:hypothetical protein [Sphingobacterium sp. UME9]